MKKRGEDQQRGWVVAATTSATMRVVIAAKGTDLIPGATAAGLALAGIPTGLFLGFGLTPRRHQPIEGASDGPGWVDFRRTIAAPDPAGE